MSKEKSLPDPKVNPAEWYQEVIERAEIAEHAPVRGCMVIRPYGFAIWELIRDELDRRIKGRGVSNTYFPLFIPQSFLSREKDHVEGFSPECAVVTHAGGEDLQEPLVVRPTSETIIHASMSRWIKSYRDLPLRINQWCNVVRWEKRPRLFLRNTEFLWQEGHTAHATESEARKEVGEMLNLYHEFVADILAIPTICGVKSEREKFAGAVESSSIEGLMPDGKGLQMGTVHYLGENFSRMADVKFLDADSAHHFVKMTSWGVSTRLMGALIMAHGDSKGLVLPPAVAPVQILIVPIGLDKNPEGVIAETARVADMLRKIGLRLAIDDRSEMTPGAKFYHWETRGVPLRIEIGPRDVEAGKVSLVWRVGGDGRVSLGADRLGEIPGQLESFQRMLLERATCSLNERIITAQGKGDFIDHIGRQVGFIRAGWCGSEACEAEIKETTSATIRNIPHVEAHGDGSCIWCGEKGKFTVYFAKAY
jgi:prolyl-tRNA synthetase